MVARVCICLLYTDLVNEMHQTELVFKIRGGIPICAARALVGGVWPRAKYGCCSALRWQKSGPFFLVQFCGTYKSPTDDTQA